MLTTSDQKSGDTPLPASDGATQPLVSVVVPVYNVGDYLDECLRSLASQTLSALQVILVDDGSCDGSGERAAGWASALDNFEYHRTEHLGQGHARNFGVQFARGDYLAFADSDDCVEPAAYEQMHALALASGADLVVGGADRFNSSRHWSDPLHQRALAGSWDESHIRDNPNLLYDTTPWNKLVRLDFYKKAGIRFSEGVLYEDMPACIHMHLAANKVARLDKVVYHWRVREAGEASSTQRQNDLGNFYDRMTAVLDIDELIAAYDREGILRHAQDRKLLELDFPLFLDRIPQQDEEFRSQVASTIAQYLPHIGSEALAHTKALRRIRYHLLAQGDREGLLASYRWGQAAAPTLRVRNRNGRLFGEFPFAQLDEALCEMTHEAAESGLALRIREARMDADGLHLDIRANMAQLPMKKVSLSAELVDERGNPAASFAVAGMRAHRRRTIDVSREQKSLLVLDKARRFFGLNLPAGQLCRLAPGSYRVQVRVENDGLACAPALLGQPQHASFTHPQPHSYGTLRASLGYNWRNEAVLVLAEACERIGDISLDSDGSFTLHGASARYRVEAEGGRPTVVEGCACTLPPRFFARKAEGDEQLWRALVQHDGGLRISRMEPGGVCLRCHLDGARFGFDVDVPCELAGTVHAIELVGRRFGARPAIALRKAADGTLRATVDFANAEVAQAFRDDVYDVQLAGTSPDGRPAYWPLYCAEEGPDACSRMECLGYRYHLDRSGTHMVVRVHRVRKGYERTELRRRLVQHALYPLMRLAPLDKRLVAFESYFCSATGCNPGALHAHIHANRSAYRCVWVLHDPRTQGAHGAPAVVPNTLPYFWLVARAGYLISNTEFPDSFRKRDGQRALHTMHGTPLKKIGLDVEGWLPEPGQREAFVERFNGNDYICVQNDQTARIAQRCYGFGNAFLRTGYPRTDALAAQNTPQQQAVCKQKLGLDPNRKFVLYAPTYRTAGRFDLELNLAQLDAELGDAYEFGLRRHHLSLGAFGKRDRLGTVADLSFASDLDELLLAADVLVTDYSSVMFDYALLDRPQFFFAYDLEEYRDEGRGFYFDFASESPGPVLRTTSELARALRDLDKLEESWSARRRQFAESYLAYESDHSCADVCAALFDKEQA